jgi:Contact-dependent growth inhibition CdiA C-terminal domain
VNAAGQRLLGPEAAGGFSGVAKAELGPQATPAEIAQRAMQLQTANPDVNTRQLFESMVLIAPSDAISDSAQEQYQSDARFQARRAEQLRKLAQDRVDAAAMASDANSAAVAQARAETQASWLNWDKPPARPVAPIGLNLLTDVADADGASAPKSWLYWDKPAPAQTNPDITQLAVSELSPAEQRSEQFRLMQLSLQRNDTMPSDASAQDWAQRAADLKQASERYKQLNQPSEGRVFNTDSVYNSLMADAAQARVLAGMEFDADMVNQTTKVSIENLDPAHIGSTMGAATSVGLTKLGKAVSGLGELASSVGAAPGKLVGSLDGLTTAEQNFIGEMVAGGRTVEIIPRSTAGRTADFLINGKKTELKTMLNVVNQTSDGLSKALSSTIMDARGQSGQIIIDARQQTGMTPEIAERGIGRAFGRDDQLGSKIQNITVITPQGTVYMTPSK